MAANKFATMLHRNTNKLTLILIYAILEWVLIFLLLLNSLFSYLIVKFADYFGLKRPCLWCSRLDHLFEPGNKTKHSYRDLVCEEHAIEISKLGFCSNHHKLAESQDMCEGCSSQQDCQEWSNKFAFFPWMKQIGMIQEDHDDKEEVNIKCSCCGVSLSDKGYPPCILLKSSWGVLDYSKKPVFNSDAGVDAQTEKEGDGSDQSGSDQNEGVNVVEGDKGGSSVSDCGQRDYEAEETNNSACCSVCDYVCKETEAVTNQNEEEAHLNVSMVGEDDVRGRGQVSCDENKSCASLHRHLEFYIDQDDCRLVPVELFDSPANIETNNSACCSVCDYVCKETEAVTNQNEEEAHLNVSMVGEDDVRGRGQVSCDENKSCASLHRHLEFYIDQDDCRLVPVELFDSPANIERQSYKVEEDQANSDTQDVILDFDMHFETQAKPVVECWHSSDEIVEVLSSHESKEESKVVVLDSKDLDSDMHVETQAKQLVECRHSSDEIVELLPSHESKQESKDPVPDMHFEAQAKPVAEHLESSDEMMELLSSHESKVDGKVLETKDLDFDMHFETQAKPVGESWDSSGKVVELLSSHESKEESKASVLDSKDFGQNGEEVEVNEQDEDTTSTQAAPVPCHENGSQSNAADIVGRDIDSEVHQAATTEDDDNIHMRNVGSDAEVSIGTDIPDHDIFNEDSESARELLHSYPNVQEDPSTSSPKVDNDDNHESKQEYEEFLEFKILSVETSDKAPKGYFSLGSELNEIEEEKVLPDTPTSIDNFNQLYNRMLQIERRESGTEASLDGSVVSDIDCGDGVLTMEQLKSVLRVERKALNRVYAELEEERSASAIAANQTMAMINRLQEEKAAMQMEALQYQRMMDEQSEYDQEAMQLLNELMVKREKEKQELEKELEICRKKVQDYEAREKMMILRRMKEGCIRSRTSSSPCSNAEDSDGLSVDLNHELKEEDNFSGHEEGSTQNTPRDAVLYLEESLASFEEEKLSILDQLKELEEKLLTLNDEEEEEHYEDIKPIDHLISENGNGYHDTGDVFSEENGIANGHGTKEMDGTHHLDRKIMASIKAKRLLPLFNEAEDEDEESNGYAEGYGSVASQEQKKLAIEEEVDHVYERLQALEADREFLKHCISSLRKGDKGLDLLQEILQHLRDLRSVETRLRNSGEFVL